MSDNYRDFGYTSADSPHTAAYIERDVLALVRRYAPAGASVLEAGCGNGWFSRTLAAAGYTVSAFDLSESGIASAKAADPTITYRQLSVYDDVRASFGQSFDAVVALEVIEHLYDPRAFVSRLHEALVPGGFLILSTPYHGYLKNLALAVSGKLDQHFTALWNGGHIKFWSRRTATVLLQEMGFEVVAFKGAGRLPFLWKSMILVARKRA